MAGATLVIAMNLSHELIEASGELTERVRKRYRTLAFAAWHRETIDEPPKLVFGFELKEPKSLRSLYEAILHCHQEIEKKHQKVLSLLQITVVTATEKQFKEILSKITVPVNIYAKNAVDVSNAVLNLPDTTETLALYRTRLGLKGRPNGTGKLTIELKRTTSGSYYFSIVTSNGYVLMISGTYASKSTALNAIASTKRNAAIAKSYEVLMTTTGEPYFILKARNGVVLAQSGIHANESAIMKWIERITNSSLILQCNQSKSR